MGTKGAVGMLRVKLGDALKVAMKSNNRRAVSTLRLILAALKERDIAHRTQGADEEGVSEEEIIKLLQSMIKQRRDSIDAYNKGGRKELAEGEAEEIEMEAGDTAFIPAGEKHWHGAADGHDFSHISLTRPDSVTEMFSKFLVFIIKSK